MVPAIYFHCVHGNRKSWSQPVIQALEEYFIVQYPQTSCHTSVPSNPTEAQVCCRGCNYGRIQSTELWNEELPWDFCSTGREDLDLRQQFIQVQNPECNQVFCWFLNLFLKRQPPLAFRNESFWLKLIYPVQGKVSFASKNLYVRFVFQNRLPDPNVCWLLHHVCVNH